MSTGTPSGSRALRLRLGAFVVVAGLLLAALILMFGSLPGLFKRTTAYVVRFSDAPGLTAGAPVRRSGVRIGSVKRISLDEERGIVRAELAIDSPYSIRRNEQATLVTGLLGSDTSIDLVPRPAADGEEIDRQPLEAGAELVGVRAANVGTLLKGATDVVPTTQETLNDIRKSLQRLDKLAARAEKAIPLAEETMREYRDLAKDVRKQVPELAKTNSEVREFAKSAREVLPEVTRAIEEYRLLGRDARAALPELMKTNKEVQDFTRDARGLLPTIERTVVEYRELAAEARKLAPTVRGTIDDIGAAARNATRLLERADILLQDNRDRVEEVIKNLNAATANAARLLSDENITNATKTLANARTASESLPRIATNVDDILMQGRTTVRRLNDTLLRVEAALVDIQKITQPLGARSGAIVRNIDEGSARLNEVLGDVRALMRVIDTSNGTLRKFLTDPSLYNNIDCAVVRVTKLLPQVEKILADFGVFADKLARHPEKLGLGGVVRPDSGLKGPTTPQVVPQGPPGVIIHAPQKQGGR